MKPSDVVPTPLTLSTLVIPQYSYNTSRVEELILNNLPQLKQIVIGSFSFNFTRVFAMYRLTALETLAIGQESFVMAPQRRFDGEFYIANCPNLKSIVINVFSFADYSLITVNDLPSLQLIQFSAGTFYFMPYLNIVSWSEWVVGRIDFPQLQTLIFGQYAFREINEAAIGSGLVSPDTSRSAATASVLRLQ